MGTRATASFDITSWEEHPYDEVVGLPTLSRASVTVTYGGDIDGTGKWETLMVYDESGSATYTGLERIVGRLAGLEGSFVLRHTGVYEDGHATTRWTVVPDSGTGHLRGLRGEGGYVAAKGGHVDGVTLDYEIATA